MPYRSFAVIAIVMAIAVGAWRPAILLMALARMLAPVLLQVFAVISIAARQIVVICVSPAVVIMSCEAVLRARDRWLKKAERGRQYQ
jgi:hypothetical protein